MTAIPQEAALGFELGAAAYERGRPGYPEAAIARLADELDLGPERVIVDLAAGTGKLTRALLGLGARVVAIEPVAGMREQLRRAVPGIEVLDGTAELMPLGDGSAHAVLVAQAFHWFDVPAAATEIHRILTVGGGLGVVRNEWDESVDWIVGLRALTAKHAARIERDRSDDWREALGATGLFSPHQEQVFPNPVRVSVDTLRARIASLSFVALLDEAPRERLLDEVADMVAQRGLVAADGLLDTPYRTHITWCRRLQR
ncbi:MAG TPA: class I SAM-dependent methyltransferase [Solirubrobacteraceae bacterium]|nr:class I SAM-dependent methyltransferase [Solirubrobacteraceae bacterium]